LASDLRQFGLYPWRFATAVLLVQLAMALGG
jgi:hypothetical protein